MKKRILILVLAGMFCFTACNQGADGPAEEPKTQEEEKKDPEEEKKDEEETEDEESGDTQSGDGQEQKTDEETEVPAEKVKINVYNSNDDATAFISNETEIEALTPEKVMEALADQGVVPSDVQVLHFEQSVVDGADTVLLDVNGAFASYVSSMGTTGEYYVIGSVCNTYLEAYGCEKIKITVENGTLESGHADYPGYMTMYQ